MLLSLSVSNYRSFGTPQVFSMVASRKFKDHADHLFPVPGDDNSVLPVAVLYGPNGAGKSNLVKALRFMESLVLGGAEDQDKPLSRHAFLLDDSWASKPTEIEMQFVEKGHTYDYGVKLTDKVVLEEWLSVMREGKEVSVFERLTRDNGEVVVELGSGLSKVERGEKLPAQAKVGGLPNQLFLHTVSKSLRKQDRGPIVGAAINWFQSTLTVINPDSRFSSLANLIAHDSEFADFAGQFLRKVKTGVESLKVDTNEMDQSALAGAPEEIRGMLEKMAEGETTAIESVGEGPEFVFEKGTGSKVKVSTVSSEHLTPSGAMVVMPFSEQSDGTQRLTHLLPALYAVKAKPSVYVIDEIDRSLHPLLAKGFVRAFLDACASKGSQIIFTTHETAFLDLNLLRRDEIWFADKKLPRGQTELYSLADYQVRTDLRVDKAYLEGRFEAVPPIENEWPHWVAEIMDELHGQRTKETAPNP